MMEEAIRKRAISHRKELSRRTCIMLKTQLNDALIESYALDLIESLYPLARETEARM